MGEYRRPSWDEYFMEVCGAIARRATCDRGRSGPLVQAGLPLAGGSYGNHCLANAPDIYNSTRVLKPTGGQAQAGLLKSFREE